jgi:hypothetical protein
VDADSAQLVDLNTGQARRVFLGIRVGSAAAFSDDEHYLAISTQDREVLIFECPDLEHEVSRLDHLGSSGNMAFSHVNRYLATTLSDFGTTLSEIQALLEYRFPQASQLRIFRLRKDLIREATERLALLQGRTE